MTISPSSSPSISSSSNANFSITGVRHCDDGHIEADICNFSGTITLSAESLEDHEPNTISREVIVDAVPEELESRLAATNEPCKIGEHVSSYLTTTTATTNSSGAPECLQVPPISLENSPLTVEIDSEDDNNEENRSQSLDNDHHDHGLVNASSSCHNIEHEASFMTANSSIVPNGPYIPTFSHQSSQLCVDIESEDGTRNRIQSPGISDNSGSVRFCMDHQVIQETKPKLDLTLHEACASEDADMNDLREILKSKPELAAVVDDFGDYAAHVFAKSCTDSFIYTSSDQDVQQFTIELYTAHPRAFLEQGYDGQIPFAGTICDWVDDCHQLYARNEGGVVRLSEIKTLTKSTRVINSLCVRASVQKLTNLPTQVSLPPQVLHSFKMLSFILDALSESAFKDISTRGEFWAVASKRRDSIIRSVASVPFIIRTILLIENKTERDALINTSIVRNLIFRPESVDLWLVAMLSGDERAKTCATHYLCLISRISLSGLFGRRMEWSNRDKKRFHSMRKTLYDEVGKLTGFLPCMLHLNDSLYEVATRRAVKYVVESTIGRPLPVYLMFMEGCLLLILMTSYRIIVELVYAFPSEEFLSQYRELWGLALSIAAYFASRDLAILVSFMRTEEKLARKYVTGFGNMIGYFTTASVITVLSMMYLNSNVDGHNFVGIVAGLLWWKFLLHVKGMSENLSTLIYTIVQIAITLKYFLIIFVITIFFFADMIDIVKKTSGECNDVDGAMDSSLETFCSLTPLQTYLAMYGVMIGGFETSSLEGSSSIVSILFVTASFCGVIVLVNILIAIVTGEYEKAQARSFQLFARARLEAAARLVARDGLMNPPDDDMSGVGMKLWHQSGIVKQFAILVVVEYFLVKSLLSCSLLHKNGVLGDFLYIALILCAILHHVFVVAGYMFLGAKSICNHERLRWLRGSKFHIVVLKICLVPVRRFLTNVGLGRGESCTDAYDTNEKDHPLSYNEFFGKQTEFESNMEEAMKASETRILHAMKSMVMFQIPPE